LKYENNVVLKPVGCVTNLTLNAYGKDGWELVAAVVDVDNVGRAIGSIKLIFKREII
jgi:hypothetical protein